MLIIPVKEGENIERAIKKYKKKFEKTKVMRELRSRKEFVKPSILKRQEIIKASYKQRMQSAEMKHYATRYVRGAYGSSFFYSKFFRLSRFREAVFGTYNFGIQKRS